MIGSLLRVGGVLLVCLPLSLIVTFIAMPLWRWLESSYGIESVGHSGPAQWCYVVVYGVITLMVFAIIWRRVGSATRMPK